jgi:hypothetical protein
MIPRLYRNAFGLVLYHPGGVRVYEVGRPHREPGGLYTALGKCFRQIGEGVGPGQALDDLQRRLGDYITREKLMVWLDDGQWEMPWYTEAESAYLAALDHLARLGQQGQVVRVDMP